MPVHELSTGSTLAGRYQIIEELGAGGMGFVYKVFDTDIKEKIALKLLRPEIALDRETVERFSNELKLARRISHRNVCRMFDLGKAEGTTFITMEFVPGEDLKKFMKEKYNFSYSIIEKSSYPEVLTEDIPTVGMGTSIIVHKDMTDDIAYTLTKLTNEMKDRLPAIHKSMEVFDPAIAWKDQPVPLHPGAIKYYKEKGLMK